MRRSTALGDPGSGFSVTSELYGAMQPGHRGSARRPYGVPGSSAHAARGPNRRIAQTSSGSGSPSSSCSSRPLRTATIVAP